MTRSSENKRIPQNVRPHYEEIVEMIERVCQAHLNEEYAEMAREMAAHLARKRPSPLLQGRPDIWACGILYALGQINFLFDKSFEPYMKPEDLCQAFGVNKKTCATKAKQIRDLLKIHPFDPRWTLPSLLDKNPFAWLIEVNGLIVDARYVPREIQEIAYRKGLIPYIPADREEE